jgi:hypothetical protein
MPGDRSARRLIVDDARRRRDHGGLRPREGIEKDLGLERKERGHAVRLGDLPSRPAGRAFEFRIAVDERPIEPGREHAPDRRLARPHEPDEDEVTGTGNGRSHRGGRGKTGRPIGGSAATRPKP